jgi:hypothetical protein
MRANLFLLLSLSAVLGMAVAGLYERTPLPAKSLSELSSWDSADYTKQNYETLFNEKIPTSADGSLKWDFSPARGDIKTGGTLRGVLTVRNTSKSVRYWFSQPCYGSQTCNLELWLRPSNSDGKFQVLSPMFGGDVFPALTEEHIGRPLVLDPGQSWSVTIAISLNVVTEAASRGRTVPVGKGKYDACLRYVNLASRFFTGPSGERLPLSSEASREKLREDAPQPAPIGPFVMGPFKLNIR